MAFWTFFVLIGNGKRVIVDQVEADDLRSAYKQWAQVVEFGDIALSQQDRESAWRLPIDAESEFIARSDLRGVWNSVCTFGIAEEDLPMEWEGDYPAVWVIKTDVRRSERGLFE